MRRHPFLLMIVFLVLPAIACVLCDDIPSGSNAFLESILSCDGLEESSEDRVVNFPVNYGGTAQIKTWNVCDTTANAAFKAFADGTCALMITYEPAYQNFDGLQPGDAGYGACKPSGDSLLVPFFGRFDKVQQVCKFTTCNNETDYTASGSLMFSTRQAAGVSDLITCTENSNGEVDIEVDVSTLAPSTSP